ncbi:MULTISPECIES: cytidylate kinase-like family protein [Lacrimispora]|uniref:cytidylate kinase family protein n=1 Tax=Lacrimispora TaxID=2719231 RepID=UPI000BE465A9
MNRAITISREFGSGGRELGMRLSKKLEIPFYDKELISLTAQETNLSETELLSYYESIPVTEQSLEPTIYTSFSPLYEVPISDQVFLAQSRVVKYLAEQGPCIIVGRCADRVLEESINLFVYAEIENRVKRISSFYKDMDPGIIENEIRETDRKRKDYYQYYTGCEWGKAQNYHLCLNSGFAGVSACLQAVLSYLEHCI